MTGLKIVCHVIRVFDFAYKITNFIQITQEVIKYPILFRNFAAKSNQLCVISDTVTTISAASAGIYKDKGSKFLAFAEPVDNVEQIKQRLEYYRKEYYDARHVCYAYMLGAERKEFRANDDGEPSGTAGRPILWQINSRQLTNVLIVVVRYFGGILLGTSGLIIAYKEAAKDALNNANIVEKDLLVRKTLRFPYEKMSETMKLIRDTDSVILSQDFDGQCIMEIEIKQKYESRFQ